MVSDIQKQTVRFREGNYDSLNLLIITLS